MNTEHEIILNNILKNCYIDKRDGTQWDIYSDKDEYNQYKELCEERYKNDMEVYEYEDPSVLIFVYSDENSFNIDTFLQEANRIFKNGKGDVGIDSCTYNNFDDFVTDLKQIITYKK